jgi:predicted KAP-like P-loop ATPase
VTNTDWNSNLAPDAALQSPSEDKLGYSDFAAHISDTISGWTLNEEFVVGIYGEWGSGKSTILNFVESELKEQDDPPIIIRFNPWWFSGQADLIQKFFSQLRTGLGTGENYEETREKIASLSKTVSKVPFSKLTGVPAGPIIGAAADYISVDNENIGQLKTAISEDLREINQPIVIFIDDIDRLTTDEIRQMFRLVKSVADFPNVIYVLAFDRNIVSDALEAGERGVRNGDEYLEKIIQLPQHVPIPQEGSLDQFFTNRLDAIVGDDEIVFNQSHWQSVYEKGISPVINTPRDAIRLANAVKTSYQALRHEVNYVDLIAIEALRIYFSGIYDEVRTNKERFTERRQITQSKDEDYSDLWEDLNESNQDCAEMLLSYLFPRCRKSLDITFIYSISENNETYRKRKRICHPEMFAYYFRQTVPEGEIPMEEFEAIVASTENPKQFEEHLRELANKNRESGRSQAHNFLKRFNEHATDSDHPQEVVNVLFRLSDYLIETDPSLNSLDRGNRSHLFQTVHTIADQVEDPTELLKTGVQQNGSSYFAAYFIGLLLQEHGENGGNKRHEQNRLLPREDITELQQEWVTQIEQRAQSGSLSDATKLDHILNRWSEWGSPEDATEWVQQYASDDESLLRLVEDFVRTGRSSATGETEYIDPEWIDPFIDQGVVEDQLDSVDSDDLTQRQQEVVDVFWKAVEFQEADKDPSEFETWIFEGR